MQITLYIGKGFDWSNALEPKDWERANEVAVWLACQAVERYGDVKLVTGGAYGPRLQCYDEATQIPDFELEERLSEILDETLRLLAENHNFWLRVRIPWEPCARCQYDVFLRRERAGDIRVVEPRDAEARQGLYALTDLSEESWVGEVAEISPEVFPNVRVGDYAVCDGIGAPVRFYRLGF